MKEHLNPGGVMTLFVQLYESNPAAVKSEIATFLEAFPNGVVWGNTQNGAGYDLVLMGTVDPIKIDVDRIDQTLKSGVRAGRALALGNRHVLGDRPVLDLRGQAAGSRSVDGRRDYQPRSQPAAAALAGLGLNLYQSDVIYADMLKYATHYPEELFAGVPGDDPGAPGRDCEAAGVGGCQFPVSSSQ